MVLKAESKSVNEVKPQEYSQRFICNSDFSDYSVEAVVQLSKDSSQAVLTVWNDRDVVVNNKSFDIELEEGEVKDVADWFDDFLLDEVNKYLK